MPSDLENAISDSSVFMIGPDQELSFLPEPEPRAVWCPVISADDHAFEPPTLFDTVPERHQEHVPKWIEVDGRPAWQVGDKQHFFTGMDGAANRPVSEWRSMKMRLEDYRTSVYDTDARVRDMDLNGVWASLCFPTITWGFAGTTISRIADSDAAVACVQAYNDWWESASMMVMAVMSRPLGSVVGAMQDRRWLASADGTDVGHTDVVAPPPGCL